MQDKTRQDKTRQDKTRHNIMKYITPYVTAHTSGFLSANNTGLGNVLFQIASIYGISKTYGMTAVFPNVKRYCDILFDRFHFLHRHTILRHLYEQVDPDVSFPHIIYERENMNRTYDTDMIHTIQTVNDNTMIHGYLECYSYFEDSIEDIRHLFSIDDQSMRMIRHLYGDLLFSTDYTTVSIHFRGNEYLTIMNSPYDYDYYNRAIQYISQSVRSAPLHFLIFTDDPQSIDLTRLPSMTSHTFISSSYDYLDLWTMSLCAHHILCRSTFSWWGARLHHTGTPLVVYRKEDHCDMMKGFIGI